MNASDISHCIGLLLHCVNLDNQVGKDNALLQYCGLRILEQAADSELTPQDFNTAIWALRNRISVPPVRFIKSDPMQTSKRGLLGVQSVLALPNTISLDSSSTLLVQARSRFPSRMVQSEAAMGDVVRAKVESGLAYHEIWNLVCREPTNPTINLLSRCFDELAPYGMVAFISAPIFGREEEAEQWVHAISGWLASRDNIQRASTFLDLYFIKQSERLAVRISSLLRDIGVQHEWPSND